MNKVYTYIHHSNTVPPKNAVYAILWCYDGDKSSGFIA